MEKKTIERLTVQVPVAEKAMFKRLMRAMGYKIEKKCGLDYALDDIANGRIHSYDSVDEMFESMGITR